MWFKVKLNINRFNMNQKVNIGLAIEQRINALGISKSELARRLGIAQQNVNKLVFERQSIDTEKLVEISQALDFDFFSLYSSALGGDDEEGAVQRNGNNSPHVKQIIGSDDSETVRSLLSMIQQKDERIADLTDRLLGRQ